MYCTFIRPMYVPHKSYIRPLYVPHTSYRHIQCTHIRRKLGKLLKLPGRPQLSYVGLGMDCDEFWGTVSVVSMGKTQT